MPKTILVVSIACWHAPQCGPVQILTLGHLGLFRCFSVPATNLVSQSSSGVQQIYLESGCSVLSILQASCPLNNVLLSVTRAALPAAKIRRTQRWTPKAGVGFQSLATHRGEYARQRLSANHLRATCVAFTSVSPGGVCKKTAEAASVDASGQLGTGDSVTPAVSSFGSSPCSRRAHQIFCLRYDEPADFCGHTCLVCRPIPIPAWLPRGSHLCGPDGLPGQGDSSNPTLGGSNRIAFTSQASLLPGVSGRQVLLAMLCLFRRTPVPA